MKKKKQREKWKTTTVQEMKGKNIEFQGNISQNGLHKSFRETLKREISLDP